MEERRVIMYVTRGACGGPLKRGKRAKSHHSHFQGDKKEGRNSREMVKVSSSQHQRCVVNTVV